MNLHLLNKHDSATQNLLVGLHSIMYSNGDTLLLFTIKRLVVFTGGGGVNYSTGIRTAFEKLKVCAGKLILLFFPTLGIAQEPVATEPVY